MRAVSTKSKGSAGVEVINWNGTFIAQKAVCVFGFGFSQAACIKIKKHDEF